MTAPTIYHREQWGAAEPTRSYTPRPTELIRTVYGHYSDTHETIPAPGHAHDVVVVQAIQRYHQSKGYVDIAYAVLIGGNGDIYLGRPNDVVQAAVMGHNVDEWSVCFLTDGPITKAQQDSFLFVMYLADITFKNVSHKPEPHSAGSQTRCPGPIITAFLSGVS